CWTDGSRLRRRGCGGKLTATNSRCKFLEQLDKPALALTGQSTSRWPAQPSVPVTDFPEGGAVLDLKTPSYDDRCLRAAHAAKFTDHSGATHNAPSSPHSRPAQ